MYTNNFCFGYITVSCFFETFPGGWLAGGGWVVGESDLNENPVVSLDLDFVNFVTIAKVPCTAPNLSHGIKLITTTPLKEYIHLPGFESQCFLLSTYSPKL